MNQQSIWQETIEVRTYECDNCGLWKPAAFFRAMEEVTVRHAFHLKTDYFTLQQFDLAWVLARTKIRFEHFPNAGTRVIVKTWPKGWQQKIFGMRDYNLSTENGKVLARATTAWLLMNTKTRHFVKPEMLPHALPDNDGLSALDEPLEKLVHPDNMQETEVFKARYSTLDLMGHVNNTIYIDWIFDCFTAEYLNEKTVDWLQINYSSETRPEECVLISTGKTGDRQKSIVFSGVNQNTGLIAFDAQLGWKK